MAKQDKHLDRDRQIQKLWNEQGLDATTIGAQFDLSTNDVGQMIYQRRKQGWDFQRRYKQKGLKASPVPSKPKPSHTGAVITLPQARPSSVVFKQPDLRVRPQAKHCLMESGNGQLCGKPVTIESPMGFCRDCTQSLENLAKGAR